MTRYLIYFNYDIGAYAPVVGATVQWYIYDYYNNVVASYYGVTGADGGYPGPCVNYPNWYYANTMYWLENADVRVVSGGSSLIVSDCDTSTPSDYASTPHAWLFARYNEFIPFSRNLLNVSRALIPIAYDPNLNGAQYTSSNDQITFGPSTLYYQYGRFTVAHEYGHAIHEKALSGNAASGQCPVPHYLNGRYNLACALSEGFGDFVGATSQNVYDVGDYYLFIVDYTNHAWFSPGTDESIQEAAVAALFYDLTDSPGGDGGASEPWDQTLGERVSATIRDCRIRLPNAFVTRIRGVDDFVYCAERTIDASVKASYFQTRTSASRAQSITANASSSPYWPQSGVRAVWRMNLYGLN